MRGTILYGIRKDMTGNRLSVSVRKILVKRCFVPYCSSVKAKVQLFLASKFVYFILLIQINVPFKIISDH